MRIMPGKLSRSSIDASYGWGVLRTHASSTPWPDIKPALSHVKKSSRECLVPFPWAAREETFLKAAALLTAKFGENHFLHLPADGTCLYTWPLVLPPLRPFSAVEVPGLISSADRKKANRVAKQRKYESALFDGRVFSQIAHLTDTTVSDLFGGLIGLTKVPAMWIGNITNSDFVRPSKYASWKHSRYSLSATPSRRAFWVRVPWSAERISGP